MNKSQLYSWSKLNNNDNEKSNAFKNIGELYYSLCECVAYSQGIYELPPLYINVCIDKWLNFGCSYKSNINKCYLFENVDTNFIDYIKEIPAKINNKIDIKTLFNLYGIEIYPTYDKETIDIPSDFDNFIKNNFTNRVGDYLAINIGKESFSKAYLKDKSIFKGVSNRFNDMIKYILITYFNSKQIDIENKNLINAINKSTSDYLQEIIDRKCILIDSFFK